MTDYTALPTVSASTIQDIICAVQASVSTQQTLQQVLNLFLQNTIFYNSGDPNGSIAGMTYQFCWDTLNAQLFICTQSGTSLTAQWTQVGSSTTINNFYSCLTATPLTVNNTFQSASNTTRVAFTLPTVAQLGDSIRVTGFGSAGWIINQNSSQRIVVSNVSSTVGTSGSLSSQQQFDSVELICVQANLTFQAIVAPQGNLTIL
jgi:hypothetical protein